MTPDLLEFFIFDEFNDDIFFRLNLQHFEDEADEISRLNVASVDATDGSQFNRLVHQELR